MEHYLQFPLCFYRQFFGQVQVPMGGCDLTLPDDRVALRGLSPSSSENFLRTLQSDRTRSHSLEANAGISPPVLHLRILRH